MPQMVGRKSTKKEAAYRQINAAIQHLYHEEYECAATLAGAAEGQLPDISTNYLFKKLSEVVPPEYKDKAEWIAWLNATRDWLKHPTPQLGDAWDLTEFAVVIMLLPKSTRYVSISWACLASGC
jgi:hypothetical protein